MTELELNAIAGSLPPQPNNPTTPAILATAPIQSSPSFAGGANVLSAADIQALISQQVMTMQSLPQSTNNNSDDIDLSTLVMASDGVGVLAGYGKCCQDCCGTGIIITPEQASASGSSFKPGADNFIKTKINEGAEQGLLYKEFSSTGTVPTTRQQAAMMQQSYVNTANQLLNDGTIKGNENSPAMAVLISIGAALGFKALSAFLSAPKGGGFSAAIGAITDPFTSTYNSVASAIGSGARFATQMADKIGSGYTGLSNSISGLFNSKSGSSGGPSFTDSVGNGISKIAAGLKSTLKSAYQTVEASYKDLTANKPNKLGAKETDIKIDTPVSAYDSATAEIEICENKYFDAKKAYRNEQTPETAEALRKAEANLTAARQKQAAAQRAFIGKSVDSVTNFLGFGSSSPSTTANSGLNALPGGESAVVNQVNGQTSSAVSATAIAGNEELAAQAPSMTGDLVGNTMKFLSSGYNAAKGAATSLFSSIQTSLSSNGNSGGQVKAATAATDTYDKTETVAKTGQLLGDSKVPNPSTVITAPTNSNSSPDAASNQVTSAYNELSAATTAERMQLAKIQGLESTDNFDSADYTNEWNKYQELQKQTAIAQERYVTALRA